MLLHHAIRIVEKESPINDSAKSTNLDFKLFNQDTGKKYDYIVFGNQCEHFGNKFIDLQDVVDGFNSQNREYRCPHCPNTYKEISDFRPHDLNRRIKNEFHPETDKISILHGILLAHMKRNKKRFCDPLTSEKIKNKIINLLTYRNDDQFQNNSQFCVLAQKDQRLKLNNSFQFQSLCLLDNVNINIPVRHIDCKHIEAYELTSLITYQIESYRDLKNKQLKERESVKYFKCMQKNCGSIFPMYSEQDLLDSLVVDFTFLTTIKKAYPGNQLYVVNRENNNQIVLTDWISNCYENNDVFIRRYWMMNNNQKELEKLFTYNQFQKSIIEKMATLMNQDLRDKEKINQYKNSECLIKLKDYTGFMIEYPARCINCSIPQQIQNQQIEPLKNLDIRTFIAYIIHKQAIAKFKELNFDKLNCPLCQKEFKKNLVQIQLNNNENIFYDAQLYSKMQSNIQQIKDDPENLFKYKGKQYLLEQFQNLWKYTREDFLNDENIGENKVIQYQSLKCQNYRDISLKHPLINFKCKNQIRFNFDYFYKKYQENQYSFKDGLKLCKCEGTECELVTEVEEQLYYDHIWMEAYEKKLTHFSCESGFEYNLLTKEFRELKKGEYVLKRLIAPVVRHFREDDQLERGVSFKWQTSKQIQ